jgi:hypothetical protein
VFASATEARSVVGFLREHGIASIDVGCFQVNLHHHPAAFASVEEGFDPDANADYAARFLRRLFERSGSWEAAIGDYHSAEPGLGEGYRAKVLRAWHGLHTKTREPELAAATQGDPHVILLPATVALIPVYTPSTLPPALRTVLGLRMGLGPSAPAPRKAASAL